MRPHCRSKTHRGSDVEKENLFVRDKVVFCFVIFSPVELNKDIIPCYSCRKCCCLENPQHSRRCPRWTAVQGGFSLAASLSFLSSLNSSSLFLDSLCLPCVGLLCGCSKQLLPPGSRRNWEQNTNGVLQWLQETFVLLKWGGSRERDGQTDTGRE